MDAYDSTWGIEGAGHGIVNGRGEELNEIYIPVRETNEVVAVSLSALPEDPTDVLEILQAEQAPLGLWLEFAKAYLRQGKEEEFKIVLEDGSSPGMSSVIPYPYISDAWNPLRDIESAPSGYDNRVSTLGVCRWHTTNDRG